MNPVLLSKSSSGCPIPAPVSPIIRTDGIVKSQQDDRLYRGLVLENGLRVVLVSDPTTDKAAAALDVNVGHMVDPVDLPGLAHFCEHMLFLGTEKFPDENEYSKFLNQHGGSSNAYTSSDHTNFYFDCSPSSLPDALDRFSQTATDREVLAVNSEHEKNVPSDSWRIKQLEHSLSDPSHDYHKFGTGNKQTLDEIPKSKGVNVRDELLKFHDKWYSSNIMALAVLGNQSLNELESLVTDLFSGVKNKSVTVPSWEKHPFRSEDSKTLAYVVPIKDVRNLNVIFPLPDLHPYYKTGPGHYLGHLIGHEGKGSLLSELKSRGWANSLIGGQKLGSKGFSFFVVNVDLSLEGMDNIDNIVSLVFQYLAMLRTVGPLEWVFEECKNINSMQFMFKDKERPQGYVCSMANNIHDYPMDEVLSGGYILSEWRPELITMVLDQLVPENVRISVIAQKYEDVATETEEWYGTKYCLKKIPEETLKEWTFAPVHANLKLPEKNEFIPTNFELVERDPFDTKNPTIIRETELTRLWFKQDNEFFRPKSSLNFDLKSPIAYLDPNHANLTYLYVMLFKDALNEYAYAAELAGLVYSLSNTKHGISLSIRGYNEKQHVLLERILTKMVTFQVEPERFKVLKEAYQRGLRNFAMEQPHQHAVYYNSMLLAEKVWQKNELLDELEGATVADVQEFIGRLLSKLHIEALMHGNLTEREALDMMQTVENKLQLEAKTRPLLRSQRLKDREVKLRSNSHSVYTTTNDVHKSSCIEIYYQCGLQQTRENMILELFAQIVNEPCFDTLRTKEQLGYIVFSGLRRSCGVQGLRVIIQSERHPSYLDERIECFLAAMEKHVEEMSEKEFEQNKTALADRRLEKPKKISSRTAKFWGEIVSEQYHFDRDEVEVDELRTLAKKDVLDLFKQFIAAGASKRRKLACHVVSMAEEGAGRSNDSPPPKTNASAIAVTSPVEFRNGLSLHPMVQPYVNPESLLRKKTDTEIQS